MSDLIERQKAIDAMTNTLWHYPNECYKNLNEYEFSKGLAELGLKSVPSAQSEIEESLYQYKCFITDTEGLQHEVVHVGDIRRVMGWEI